MSDKKINNLLYSKNYFINDKDTELIREKAINIECSIVDDLLPTYIENLTNEATNQYIKKHISICKQCASKLKNMSEEIIIEDFNQDEEINYLKNINKKINKTRVYSCMIIVFLVIVIMILIS